MNIKSKRTQMYRQIQVSISTYTYSHTCIHIFTDIVFTCVCMFAHIHTIRTVHASEHRIIQVFKQGTKDKHSKCGGSGVCEAVAGAQLSNRVA